MAERHRRARKVRLRDPWAVPLKELAGIALAGGLTAALITALGLGVLL